MARVTKIGRTWANGGNAPDRCGRRNAICKIFRGSPFADAQALRIVYQHGGCRGLCLWAVFPFGVAPAPVGVAVQSLTAEELTQALEERRKADAIAVEKKRLEEDAQRKAAAEAEAKRVADAELEQARQRRQKAEAELAQLRAEIAARQEAGKSANEQAQQAADRRAAEEKARKEAEAEAAALRQAEQDAQNKASAEADAKRQADEALAKAQAELQQAEAEAGRRAEAEAAKRLADEQARAKADTEEAARRQALDVAQRKAEAEAASRRQADEALANRAKDEAEAKIQPNATAEGDKAAAALAKLKEEGDAAERSLRLDQPDRQRVQVALTSLGFDTRGIDGMFGPRSREMIAAWQRARSQPATGFLTGPQRQALTKEATLALSKYDEQKKAEEDAKTVPAATATEPSPPASSPNVVAAAPPAVGSTGTMYDGRYSGKVPFVYRGVASAQIANGRGMVELTIPGCDVSRLSITVSPTGRISGEGTVKCKLSSGFSGPVEISSVPGTQVGQLVLNLWNGQHAVVIRLRSTQ